MRKFFSVLAIIGLVLICAASSMQKKDDAIQPKTWKLPLYMQENLIHFVNDYNRQLESKIETYKSELRARFSEFKDMPQNALLDIQSGTFIRKEDFERIKKETASTTKK